jgi:hypothetical protein
VLHNLALLLRFTDRLGEAAEMERRAITIREKALVQDHPNLAASLENYAALLRAAGESSEAEIYEARATAIHRHEPPTRKAHNREPIQGAP